MDGYVLAPIYISSPVDARGAMLLERGVISGLRREKLLDESSGVVRVLFREEVATFHGLPLGTRSPLPPNA